MYSSLGNHDYGDYVAWPSVQEKAANLEKLKQVHASLGWRLLMNEHVLLEKEENKLPCWVSKLGCQRSFSKYGKMNAAIREQKNTI